MFSWFTVFVLVGFSVVLTFFTWRLRLTRIRTTVFGTKKVIGFFHPNWHLVFNAENILTLLSAGGGGGERVLWLIIHTLQRAYKNIHIVIYTVDQLKRDEIIGKVKQTFNVDLPHPDSIEFIHLKKGHLITAARWPRFTLLGQSLGSMILAWEALWKCYPHVFFDSTGHAFTFPVVRFLGSAKIGCYVHYPTISTDMLSKVSARVAGFNNSSTVAGSWFKTQTKLMYDPNVVVSPHRCDSYYRLFAFVYGLAGRFASAVMANSTWTANHILQIWKRTPAVVYPPCAVGPLSDAPLNNRKPWVISVAQFRPEKNHELMMRSFKRFVEQSHPPADVKLYLVGGCRDDGDRHRLELFQELAGSLGIQDRVVFKVNVPYKELVELLTSSQVYLHCMANEHFGISVVEGMAAGCIPLAHDSAGPKMDIVVPYEQRQTGYLAVDEESYAKCLGQIFELPVKQRTQMAVSARLQSMKFDDARFAERFQEIAVQTKIFD